jgi:2-succinyl-6-hydroxy-2,4-cyclohexadiene-1-carboxylate synthase
MARIGLNGIHLNVTVAGHGPPVLLLHGFTGSAATWSPFRSHWPGFTLVAVDLIGHGESDAPPDPERYRVERCIDDLIALLDHLAIAGAAVLGYSMGGRVALRFALAAPERISALVLESASPGIAGVPERMARLAADARLAEMIEREGLTAFVDYWERIPLWASQVSLPPAERLRLRQQRLANDPVGLANSLRGMSAGHEASVLDRLPAITVPTLLLAGALDEKYRELAAQMAARLPRSRIEIVPGAGHAVHLEQPEVFARAVREFLTSSLPKE